jgi:mRNA-degrading endonuclease HigB of HigAB toxin-antitoxin module
VVLTKNRPQSPAPDGHHSASGRAVVAGEGANACYKAASRLKRQQRLPILQVAIGFLPMSLHNASMVIVGLESIEVTLKKHAAARGPVARWTMIAARAQWQNIIDVRRVLPTADAIKGTDLTCFNIGGGNFRLMTVIFYQSQTVRLRELLTHAKYTKKYT